MCCFWGSELCDHSFQGDISPQVDLISIFVSLFYFCFFQMTSFSCCWGQMILLSDGSCLHSEQTLCIILHPSASHHPLRCSCHPLRIKGWQAHPTRSWPNMVLVSPVSQSKIKTVTSPSMSFSEKVGASHAADPLKHNLSSWITHKHVTKCLSVWKPLKAWCNYSFHSPVRMHLAQQDLQESWQSRIHKKDVWHNSIKIRKRPRQ